jgi:hypothetical protein
LSDISLTKTRELKQGFFTPKEMSWTRKMIKPSKNTSCKSSAKSQTDWPLFVVNFVNHPMPGYPNCEPQMLRPLNFGYCLGVAQFYQNCPFPPTTFLMEPGKPKFWTGNSSSRPHFLGCQVSCVDVLHNDNLSEPLLSIKRGWRLCMCSSYVFKYIKYKYIIYYGFTQKLGTPNSCGLSYFSSSGCNEFGFLGSPPPLLCIHSAASLAAACGWALCFVVPSGYLTVRHGKWPIYRWFTY